MISEEHITAFRWASPQELDEIMHMSLRVNDFLSGLFLAIGIRLVDFKQNSGVGGITKKSALCSPTKLAQTTAACGTFRQTKSWTRTDSAAIWAASRKPTKKSPGGSAFFRKAERPLTWTARR